MEEFNWERVNKWRAEAEKIVSDAKRSAGTAADYFVEPIVRRGAAMDALVAINRLQSRLAALSEWRPAIERLGTPREVQNLEAALNKVLDKLFEARKERDDAQVEAARLRVLLEAAEACAPVARNPDVL